MTKNKNIIVTKKSAGERLDVFLANELKLSRSQTQKMIIAEQILVNEKIIKKTGDRVKMDDKIVCHSERAKRPKNPLITGKGSFPGGAPLGRDAQDDMRIVMETADYIVVNKPSGMLTHSTTKNEPDSLAAILVKKYPKIKKVGDQSSPAHGGLRRASDPARPGIVHRLDKEASGLLVVARTQPMFDNLKNQFKNHTIEKEYLVLVHGRVARDWGEINFPIDRGENDRMVSLPKTRKGEEYEEGKKALTEFLVEKRFINFTLLRVTLHTGRMHQIRAHMLAYNHPVVADPIYYQKKRPTKWDKKCGRLFLHCVKLGFTDLHGIKQTFESTLPEELKEFLKLLK
ncbi:MAG: RluA family pseudouridine synthase [Candidatus Magasanikbacteria bacterium]